MSFGGHEELGALVCCSSAAGHTHPTVRTTRNGSKVFFVEGDIGATRRSIAIADAVAALDGGDCGLSVNGGRGDDDEKSNYSDER